MASLNPRKLGVQSQLVIGLQNLDTTTPGNAVVVQVLVDNTLRAVSTGADIGTGVVTLSLPLISSVANKTFTSVLVDSYGRVVGGVEGSLAGDYIFNSPATRQAGGFLVVGGDVTNLDAFHANITTAVIANLTLTAPLSVSNGGTGVITANAHYVFSGPLSGGPSAPGFRLLSADDLPTFPFSKIDPHPTTVVGYGIIDVYDKTTSDARYALINHTHTGYEPTVTPGTVAQYYRGDKTWQNLNTEAIQETGSKYYYTDARARAAFSSNNANLTYDSYTGVFGFSSTPEFSSITVNNAPTQPTQAANKAYVDNAVSNLSLRETSELFIVTSSLVFSYALTHPTIASTVEVFLNGLACIQDITLPGQAVVFNGSVVLTPGDTILVKYRY